MSQYRRSAHTVYQLHYHFVFITKYRKAALRGEVGEQLRDLVREICRTDDIEIIRGHVRPDHVHLLLSVPPKMSPSKVMQAIKGQTSHHMLSSWKRLRREFWGRHLWARGYFVCTVGDFSEELVKRYIENQDVEPQDDSFKVTE